MQLLMCGLLSDINLTIKVQEEKLAQFVGWLIKSRIGGSVILCFQRTDLFKTWLLFKCDKNGPNIERVMVFCATWRCRKRRHFDVD